MTYDWLLIDGYSLMHRDPDCSDLLHTRFDEARLRLVRKLQNTPPLATRNTVVFDGQTGGPSYDYGPSAYEVYFSPSHQTADAVIERWVGEFGQSIQILVVTSDRLERDIVSAGGAACMSCRNFLERMNGPTKPSRPLRPRAGPTKGSFVLGDFFPDSKDAP